MISLILLSCYNETVFSCVHTSLAGCRDSSDSILELSRIMLKTFRMLIPKIPMLCFKENLLISCQHAISLSASYLQDKACPAVRQCWLQGNSDRHCWHNHSNWQTSYATLWPCNQHAQTTWGSIIVYMSEFLCNKFSMNCWKTVLRISNCYWCNSRICFIYVNVIEFGRDFFFICLVFNWFAINRSSGLSDVLYLMGQKVLTR